MVEVSTFFIALKNSVTGFMKDDPMSYAASIAFYTVVSLPAILILAINTLGRAYSSDSFQDDLLQKLNQYLGPSTANQAEVILENTSLEYTGLIPQLIGWGVLLFSATTVFLSLQNSINRIWSVKVKESTGWFKIIIDRFISLAMVGSIGFILLVSLVIDSIITYLSDNINRFFSTVNIDFLWVMNQVLGFIIVAAIFSMIFRVLPDVKLKWNNTLSGGIFTAFLFVLGKYLIGLYLKNTDTGSAYGASGSLVVFLFWVYYSSIILLFGAKFTYEYTNLISKKLDVNTYATRVEEVVNTDNTL